MSTYKDQLLGKLFQDGWEHFETIEIDEWWAEDCWKLRSVQQSWGQEMTITFLVDPQWDRRHTGEKPPVWAIVATDSVPESRSPENPIALLSMSTRKFEPKLDSFVSAIREHRDALSYVGELLEPWTANGVDIALVEELEWELHDGHPLSATKPRAVARREDNDDVLFALENGPAPFAVVHLTWSGKPEARGWPKFTTYRTLALWTAECMKPDHEDYIAS